MAATVGALRITLGANTANFEAGMKRAKREAANSATSIQRSLSSIRSGFSGIGAGIIAGIGIGALAGLTKRALDYAGSLGEVAQQLGTTTKGLQELRYSASQTGVAQETLEKGLAKLNLTLSQARAGAEGPKKAFQELSRITGVEIVKSSKDADQVLRLLADAYVKTGKGSEIAAVGAAVMGRNFQKFQPLLAGGKKGIDELAESAAKLGLVLSDEQIQNADETADKLEALKRVLEARIAGIVADNAQSIMALATSLANLAAGMAKFWSQNPAKALAILGSLIGLRLGGLPGAIAGAGLGLGAGQFAKRNDAMVQRQAGDQFLRRAKLTASAKGYYAPGTSQARKDEILKDPVVNFYRTQAQLQYNKAKAITASQPNIAAAAADLSGGGEDVSDFLAGGGGKGKKAKDDSADLLRKRKDELQRAYELDRELGDSKAGILRAEQDLLTDYVERQEISHKLIDIEADQYNKQLDLDISIAKLDGTYSEQLQTATDQLRINNERKRVLEKQLVNQQVELDRQQDFNAIEETRFSIQREQLDLQAALAETAAERRTIELQILELAYRERKERLERIIAESQNWREIQQAQMELAAMPGQRAAATAGVMQGTRGPLEQYRAGLPSTAAKMNEALENVAVNGLRALEDGILSVIDGTKSLVDAFRDMASQIIAELLRIQIQRMIFNLIGAATGGSGGGFMPFMGSGGVADAAGMTFATGGYTGNMPRGKLAGFVHGREYVFDADATSRIGVGNLEAIRKGTMRPANDRGGKIGGDVYHLGGININAPMTPKQARETGAQAASAIQRRITMTKRSGM